MLQAAKRLGAPCSRPGNAVTFLSTVLCRRVDIWETPHGPGQILRVRAQRRFPLARPSSLPAAADAALVARGEYLARAGDCVACHTRPGGAPYAGGEAINSPFGPIYPPNITPDKANGIGAWSDDEFYRAMHEGIGKHGEYLYPAFPYQWFTKVSREDVDAIRAYLQTVPPSSAPSKPTRLMFPFNIREGIGAWNDLYFKPGAFVPDASKSDAMEPRRLSRRGSRPLRRLPYAQGLRDAAGDVEGVFGRRDR